MQPLATGETSRVAACPWKDGYELGYSCCDGGMGLPLSGAQCLGKEHGKALAFLKRPLS